MRQIEKDIIRAVKLRKNLTKGNSSVSCTGKGVEVRLHGHLIFSQSFKTGKATASSCGWQTNTTKSRLNALLGTFCDVGIQQKDFVWSVLEWTKDGWERTGLFTDGMSFEVN